jgi:hypothetical protein
MICDQCTIYYTSDDGTCPQCKIYAIDRLMRMTDSIQIDRHIKQYYQMIYRYYINKYNMETCNINNKIKVFMITKKRLLNNIGDYLRSNPEEIILYMSGMTDGIRKCIDAHVADLIFSNLIDYNNIYVDDKDIFKLILGIGPFIIDPWNCLYENNYLNEYFVKKDKLVSFDGLLNQWTYQNILHYFDAVEYAKCPYCSDSIVLGGFHTRCIMCNEHFHNKCFSNSYHDCKEEHFEHNIDSLIEDFANI